MAVCLFCDSSDVTQEHLYPKWTVEALRQKHPPRRDLIRGLKMSDGEVQREWWNSSPVLTSGLVCAECNSTWMSEIENTVKPILLPLILYEHPQSKRLLTKKEQTLISIWTILRAVLFDAVPDDNTYFTVEDRRRFKLEGPMVTFPNTHVWMAPYAGHPTRLLLGRQQFLEGSAHVFNCLLDCIAIQLATLRDPRRPVPWRRFQADGWDQVTRKICPQTEDIEWPPEFSLDEKTAAWFQQRFSDPPDKVHHFPPFSKKDVKDRK